MQKQNTKKRKKRKKKAWKVVITRDVNLVDFGILVLLAVWFILDLTSIL